MLDLEEKQLLINIYNGQKEMKEKIENLSTKVENLEVKVENLETEVGNLKTEVGNLKTKVGNLETEVGNLKLETRKMSQTVARIEIEHGEKLQALFDVFTINEQKIYKNTKDIEKCNKKLGKHDDEIFIIKSKVQGL